MEHPDALKGENGIIEPRMSIKRLTTVNILLILFVIVLVGFLYHLYDFRDSPSTNKLNTVDKRSIHTNVTVVLDNKVLYWTGENTTDFGDYTLEDHYISLYLLLALGILAALLLFYQRGLWRQNELERVHSAKTGLLDAQNALNNILTTAKEIEKVKQSLKETNQEEQNNP